MKTNIEKYCNKVRDKKFECQICKKKKTLNFYVYNLMIIITIKHNHASIFLKELIKKLYIRT